ncbi:hypothetical protein HPB48_021047 [Haemaphysalis longicornis]|uniref:Neuronal cell adhesion molecule n=1 Tax=Haemaphysalis longicornis TaxID=44386 RepID=A0A9J6FQM2_HAELO|nr:hypothetical protein HPB48_021047 [Haemaphysalis longicornis]
MGTFLLLALTFVTFLGAVASLPPKVVRRLDRAISETVLEKWRPLVLVTVGIRGDVATEVLRYAEPSSPSIVIESTNNVTLLERALGREMTRGAHAVLFSAPPPDGPQRIFNLLRPDTYLRPHITLVCLTPASAFGRPCGSTRRLQHSLIVLKDGNVGICKGLYELSEAELWSGLRHSGVVIACGYEGEFRDNQFATVILEALKFLNASVTLRQGGMFRTTTARRKHLEDTPADVTFVYEILTEASPSHHHISPLLLEKRVLFYAHVSQARVQASTGGQFLSRSLWAISFVAAAVFGSSLVAVAVARMTEGSLHEPGSGVLAVFLCIALSKSYTVSRAKFSSSTRRVLFSFWSLSCACIVVYVQSVLTSAVIVPLERKEVLTFRRFCEAIQKGALCPCGDSEAFVYFHLLTETGNLMNPCAENDTKTRDCLFDLEKEKCPQRVRENSRVGIAVGDGEGTCQQPLGHDLIIGQQPLGTLLRGSYIRRGYPLARNFHSLVRREMETGLFARLASLRKTACGEKLYREEFLAQNTPSVACIVGFALSTLVCAGEILMSRLSAAMSPAPALLLVLGVAVAGAVVPSPPTMVKQPKHEQLYQVSQSQDELDKPFLLECEAQGNPEPTYEWTKNNKEFDYVSYDKRISQQPRRGTLVFTKPDDVDEGLYQCRATNLHGTSVSNAVFLRKAELNNFAEESTKEVYVVEGDPLSLDCNPPTGYPRPNIFWLIQYMSGALRNVNSSRITADPEGDLHFSRVELGDALSDAVYTCSATSIFRREYKIGNKIQLKVEPTSSAGKAEHAPVKQYLSPPNLVALRGHELKLYCIYGGTPLPQISWSKRGSNPTSRRFTYANYGKTLEIRSTHAMHVKVEAAPYWLRVPDNTNAAEEESVSFECAATGIPEPKLQWFVNGVPIEKAEPNPRRKVEGPLMTIESLAKRDTAVYQCNASNPHGYAFRDFYLNVLALPPTITEAPEQLSLAVVTSRVTLRCRVFGAPRPDVKWMKEAQELTGGRYKVLDSGDLQIDDLLVTDQGEYTCYASNKFGDASASGSLEVKGKTIIRQPPENYEVAADKSATFRCNAEADPSLELKIQWLFNGQPVDPEADARMVQAGDNSLTITRTIELDSGIYTCVAHTELDSDRAQATLTVQDVPNPPQMVRVECDSLMALVEWKPTGDRRAPILSYSIQYNTSFSPDTWEDAFVNIPAPDTKFKVSMSPWANYTFRVVARNKIGPSLPSGASSRCTTPEDVPHKNPDRVMGRGDRFDNLLISWTPMPPIEHNAPGFFYKVLWKRDDLPDATWSSRLIEDWKQNRHVEYGQPTFKPYRIKVEAHNRRGQAHTAATEVIGYSGENVPLAAPQDFKLANVVDARSANFTWSPVSPESVRGHFRGYKIQTWTPDEGEEKLREVVVPANVTTALVSLFRPFSRNLVHCLVFNDMYNGPPSDSIEFNTPEGTPGPVASFEGIPMGSTGVYLLWKRPLETNGVLTGYHIYYEEVKGTQLGPKMERQPPVRDPLESRAKLAGLKPRTKYRITIQAATAQGQGDPYFIELETADQSERVPDMPDFTWAYLPDRDGHAAVQTGGLAIRAPGSPNAVAGAAWFIGMMCALALLLLLLILVCLVKRNRGGKYSVHDKEVAQGRDLDYDGGFHEYSKPAQQGAPVRGSRTSLHSSAKESDSDSMAEYGEGDPGQFWRGRLLHRRATSPSALATFV